MSYRYLPAPLKRCFAYCSLFPKNSILKKKMVVQLWIQTAWYFNPKSEKSWEKVAEEYFDELVSRSLICRRCVDGKTMFEIHDLINDLATMVSSPYCIRLGEGKLNERTRHLSYNSAEYDPYTKFDKLHRLKGLRTFLSLPSQDARCWSSNLVSDKVVCDLLPAMKQLRVLSLPYYTSFTEILTSFGNLIYLRYLNLSNIELKRLPSEICKLYNMQTLLLSGCRKLIELPEDIGKLLNLRHLDIRYTHSLRKLSEPVSTLAGVQVMKIDGLPNLQSVSEDGLPISLVQLRVGSVGGILWNTNWERLTCLSMLVIKGGRVNALMKIEALLLPVSLVSLEIYDLDDIECLDGKFLHHLTSHQKLVIRCAPKLKSLPDEGLPASLSVLSIELCPLLEASVQRKRGKKWCKIARIPSIIINNEIIT